jgi:hypothetical protein
MKMVIMMTGTCPPLARGLLVMLLLLVKMAIVLIIVDCKASTYCRAILKAKTDLMLQSLPIVMDFEEL